MGDHQQPIWRQAATHTLHASLILKAAMEAKLQEATGLLLADNEALLNLEARGPLRMSELAHSLVLSRGGTTKVIDRLEHMGLDAKRAARRVIDGTLESMWKAHISPAEAEMMVEVMDRVLAANRFDTHGL